VKVIISSAVLIVSLSVSVTAFGQGTRAGGPPAGISNRPVIDHGAAARTAERKPDTQSKAAARQNGVSTRLSQNTALKAKLATLLPEGTDMDIASSEFGNLGQFVAAVHVSHNLGIPFDQLKTKMVTDHMSLGEAIHEIKPELTEGAAKEESKKAESEAKEEIKKTS
jgi:hypothetical protein